MRLEKPRYSRYSFLDLARLAGATIGAFFTGIVASGAFWYALFLVLQNPSILPLPWPVFFSFGISATVTCLFGVGSVKLRRRVSMKYTIVPFLIGGLLAAIAGIILYSIWLWADWVTATGG